MNCILGIIYHCDLTKEELEPRVFREVTVKGFDPSAYQTVQVSEKKYVFYRFKYVAMADKVAFGWNHFKLTFGLIFVITALVLTWTR